MKRISLALISIAQLTFAIDANQVCFFEHSNYQGAQKCYNSGDNIPWVGDEWNDKFSSVQVGSNVKVKACEHGPSWLNGGECKEFTSDNNWLDTFNDKISSLQVSSKTVSSEYKKMFGATYLTTSGIDFSEFNPSKHTISAVSVDFGGASVGTYQAKVKDFGNNKYLAYLETGGNLTKGVWFEISNGVVKVTQARYKWGSGPDGDWIYYMPLATSDYSDGYGLHNLTIAYKSSNKNYEEYARINLKYTDSSGQYTFCVVSSRGGEEITNGKRLIQDTQCKPEEVSSQWIVTYAGEVRSAEDDRYCLDSTDSKEGSKAVLYECHGGQNQKWYFRGAEFRGDNKYTLASLDNKDMCYYGGWDTSGLTNCQTLEVSQNNKFYNISRQEKEYSLNKAYTNSSDLQNAFNGNMIDNPKLKSAFAFSKNVTLDVSDSYSLDLIKIVGSFKNTPYGINLITTVTSNKDVKFSDGTNNYNIAHNIKQIFSYDKNTSKWTIPSETEGKLNLNSILSNQQALMDKFANFSEITNLFIKYKEISLSVYDGFWIGDITLPVNSQIANGTKFVVTRTSAWGTTVNGVSLDSNKPYTFVYNDGEWTLDKGEINLNNTITTQQDLQNKFADVKVLSKWFTDYSKISLSVNNGFWIGNITLPINSQISKGTKFIVTRTALWGTTVNGVSLDYKTYTFTYDGTKWIQ